MYYIYIILFMYYIDIIFIIYLILYIYYILYIYIFPKETQNSPSELCKSAISSAQGLTNSGRVLAGRFVQRPFERGERPGGEEGEDKAGSSQGWKIPSYIFYFAMFCVYIYIHMNDYLNG